MIPQILSALSMIGLMGFDWWLAQEEQKQILAATNDFISEFFRDHIVQGTTYSEFITIGWILMIGFFICLYIFLYTMLVPSKKKGARR